MRTITLNILFAFYAFFSALVIFYQSTLIENINSHLDKITSTIEQSINTNDLKFKDIDDKLQILAGFKP